MTFPPKLYVMRLPSVPLKKYLRTFYPLLKPEILGHSSVHGQQTARARSPPPSASRCDPEKTVTLGRKVRTTTKRESSQLLPTRLAEGFHTNSDIVTRGQVQKECSGTL